MRYLWGSTPTTYNYTGQRLDSTGLLYYGARYYDPRIGRFTQADTIVPQPGNPQSLNRYAYALGNPLKFVDPSGHQGVCVQGICVDPTTVDWGQVVKLVTALSVQPEAAIPVVYALLMYEGVPWAMEDLGPSYSVPAEFDPSTLGATYPIPQGSTLTIESTLPVVSPIYSVTRGHIGELAAHVAMALDLPSVGGFSPEGMGHDPKGKRPEGIRKIVREIRDRLQDIQKGLGRSSNLQEYLESHAKELRLDPGDIKNLIDNLQNLGYSVESFPYIDEAVAQQVVELLQQMGVMPPP